MMEDLLAAIAEFKQRFPGWWYTIGECSVSCDATIGPDFAHCPKAVLEAFDSGIMNDIEQPSTVADALRGAMAKADAMLAELRPALP